MNSLRLWLDRLLLTAVTDQNNDIHSTTDKLNDLLVGIHHIILIKVFSLNNKLFFFVGIRHPMFSYIWDHDSSLPNLTNRMDVVIENLPQFRSQRAK